MNLLREYEKTPGQLVNRDKSAFYMHKKTSTDLRQVVAHITGFNNGAFPFKYLGCPIFYTKKKKMFYKALIKKIKDRLQHWKGKLLSFGGKTVLINNDLQSMSLYLLSTMAPT